MKKITLLLLLQWAFFAFSQESDYLKHITFKEAPFIGELNDKEKVVQKSKTGNQTRTLTLFINESTDKIFRYLLNCYNKEGVVEQSQYILSKIPIPNAFDLFRIKCNSAEILCYDYFADNDFTIEKNRGVKMIVKINDEEVSLNNSVDTYAQACGDAGTRICEDWFLVTYEEETGNIIDIIPWGTTCTKCSGGSGGGSGGGGGGGVGTGSPQACSAFYGTPVSINEGVTITGGPETRFSTNQWTFFRRGGLRMSSIEKGTQIMKNIGNGLSDWRFTALDHVSTSQTGYDSEYDITYVINSAIGTPDGGGEYATMPLYYTNKYACRRGTTAPFEEQLRSKATWCASCSGGPWVFPPALVE